MGDDNMLLYGGIIGGVVVFLLLVVLFVLYKKKKLCFKKKGEILYFNSLNLQVIGTNTLLILIALYISAFENRGRPPSRSDLSQRGEIQR